MRILGKISDSATKLLLINSLPRVDKDSKIYKIKLNFIESLIESYAEYAENIYLIEL